MAKKNKITGLILLLLAMYGHAEKNDRDQPMNIEANNAILDQKTQTSVFTGDVIIVQGTMRMRANKVSVREDKEGYQYSSGNGAPAKFMQKMDNSSDYLEAQALRFEYNGKTGILTLYDAAWIKRGTDEVRSDVITYNMNQETYEAYTPHAGRVNVVITPKKKNTSVERTDKTASSSTPLRQP